MTHLRTLTLLVALAAAAVVAPVAAADHAPLGQRFGVADSHNGPGDPGGDVDAPAFPQHVPVGWPVPKAFWMGTCDLEVPSTGGSGIGALPPISPFNCIAHGTAYAPADAQNPNPPRETTWQPGQEPSWRLDSAAQAGGHPDVTVSYWAQRWSHAPSDFGGTHGIASDGDAKDVVVKLPPGFLGNPNAVPRCPSELLATSPPSCPPETQVGMATLTLGEGGTVDPDPENPSNPEAVAPPSDQRVPIWNVEPRLGKLAEFMIVANVTGVLRVNVPIVARARTDGDFGIDAMALNLQSGLPILGVTTTFWGVPWAASHDKHRPPASFLTPDQSGIPEAGLPDAGGNQPQSYDPSWGPLRAFISNHGECAPSAPLTGIAMESWHDRGHVRNYTSQRDKPVEGCDEVPFDPSMSIAATATAADSPSGLTVEVETPQNLDPEDSVGAPLPIPSESATQGEIDDYVSDASSHWRSDAGFSTAQLKDVVVALPESLSLNPSAATGLEGCGNALLGMTEQGAPPLFDNTDPFDMSRPASQRCPDGSRIGTVEAYSPAIPAVDGDTPGEPNVTGDLVLGTPQPGDVKDSDQGLTARVFLVLRNADRGLVAKLAGTTTTDPVTGRMTGVFEQNPRVPIETVRLRVKGGPRGVIATGQRCVPKPWSGLLTPWTAAHDAGGQTAPVGGAIGPSSNCAFPFAPTLTGGMSSSVAGGSGSFTFTFRRSDGEQWLRGLSATLPHGLLANVGSVPLCKSAQAATGNCPAASKVGVVDASAGAGTPYVLEKKGSAYLTEGYKGAPYGLSTVVPVEAGPFRDAFALEPVVVRQALHVDRRTATATAVSDRFPTIHHGIPLRVRRVTLQVNRAGFMRNPTGCAQKSVVATFESSEGTRSTATHPFRATGCKRLGFKPKLALTLTGKRQTKTNGHPGIRARLTQKPGEAGIRRAEVRLPKALVLDIDNTDALCEYRDGIKDEPACPAGSVIGTARAVSPLLSKPLAGKVFFTKNIRIDKNTGREIRTLPMIVLALRGEIAVNLYGRSAVKAGRLVNVFKSVPDAPISSFALDLEGGSSGVLKVTANRRGRIDICRRVQTAEVLLSGHNRKLHDREITVKTPCKKRKARRGRGR